MDQTLPDEMLKGRRIESARALKDEDALRVEIDFVDKGGTLVIRLSHPQDWGWRGMLARRPHEVCRR